MAHSSTAKLTFPQRLLRWSVNIVWFSVLTILILVALYVGLGRQLMGNLHHFKSDIEQQVAAALGQPVAIDRIHGEWQGLDPILRVEGVELKNPGGDGRTVASLGELHLRLDSWASLRRFRVVLSEFSLRDGEASVVQQPDGRVGLEGIWLPPESETEPYALPEVALAASESFETRIGRWIRELGDVLSDPAVSVENLRLRVKPAEAEAGHFVVPHMEVRFVEGVFHASGRLAQSGEERRRTGLFALQGRHFFSGGFTGSLYLQLNSGRFFDALLRHYSWRELSIAGIDADARGWFRFSDGRLMRANGEMKLPFLQVSGRDGIVDPLRNLNLRGGWERDGDGWQARLVSDGYTWSGHEVGSTGALLHSDEGGFSVRATSLAIAPLCELASATGMLPPELHEALTSYEPRGQVRNLHLEAGDTRQWSARGELEALGVEADGGAPSVRGLNGFLEVGPEAGRVSIEPGSVEIGFPELFAANWRFSRLSGRVEWHRRGDGWWVGSQNLAGRYRGAFVEGAFGLRLRDQHDDSLSLKVGIAKARTGMLDALVPKYLVPEQLYSFLTNDVGEGRINHGWYYGHGIVGEDAAYSGFTSSLQYDFEDTDIRYHPDWPGLEKTAGRVRVQGEEAIVSIREGGVGGVALKPGMVRITPAESGVRVDVETGVRRQGEFLTPQWRQESPLPELMGAWIRDTRLSGPLEARLNMSVWPEMERAPELALEISLDQAAFSYQPADLRWQALTGKLRYDSSAGVADTTLTARFLDRPVTLEVDNRGDKPVAIRQKGTASLAVIERWSGQSLWGLSGDLDYDATLRPTEGPTLRLDAGLEDVSSPLPPPLDKEAGESHSLTTTLDFSREQRLVVDGNWNPIGAFRLAFAGTALERGSIALGVRSTRLPDEPVLSLTGSIPKLDLDRWHGAVASFPGESGGPEQSTGESTWPDMRFNLAIDEVDVASRTMGRIRAEGRHDARDGWRVGLDGDRIKGNVLVPAAPEAPLGIELANLDIPESRQPADPGATEDGLAGITADSWPKADVSVKNLRYQGRDFRNVYFLIRPAGKRIAIRDLSLSMASLDLAGDLVWQPGNGTGTTEFSGTLSGGSLKGLEALLGQPVPIRSRSTDARIDFAWPGGPADFELASLEAEIGFRLEDGTIDEESDASRLFRVFGLLNTDTIWRRLQLDFSDVYESGIAFDHMEGDALIHEGRLIFDPKVVIQAPSGGFRMSGQADLIDETLDMRLVVVLPITQNLPLAAVLFGFAPPVGGALFVIDQVFGGMLSRVTSATYSVGGTWNDPDVSLRNLFDTESDLSSYERPEMELETGEADDPAEEIRR